MLEVAFVLAPRQNLFFVELVAALRYELERLDVTTSVHPGAFPPPRPGLVYALVPPHEYFTLTHGRVGPPPEVLARTIFVCAEQPGTAFFDDNVELAQRGGAVLDINRRAVREFGRAGIAAQHLQLGYSDVWDHQAGADSRDIDVLFMGCESDRRLRWLSSYAPALWRYRCHYLLSDNSLPNWVPSASFVAEDEKWDLLRRSKVLLNLHQGESPYFEWLRVVQAISNGCVVVSEHSVDYEPLRPGEHFLAGRPETLAALVEHLLGDDHRRWLMQSAGWQHLREEVHLGNGAALIASVARRLDERSVASGATPFFRQPPPDPAASMLFRAPDNPTHGGSGDTAGLRRALKEVKLDLIDLGRRLDRLSRERGGASGPEVVIERRTTGYARVSPEITVLLSLYNYAGYVGEALDSLLRTHLPTWEVVIVDDGSTDESLARVDAWLARHDAVPGLLLRHPVNRGLAHARNSALDLARGRHCFVLDADNMVYPHCLARLHDALESDPDAVFAYGMLERFSRGRSVGLMNVFPWDPRRLRQGNHIDAMALIRTDVLRSLGAYSTDRRLYGWEDYDLWSRIAEHGRHGVLVPEVVARYRTSQHSMISITNISPTDAFSLIAERNPTIMAGVTVPH